MNKMANFVQDAAESVVRHQTEFPNETIRTNIIAKYMFVIAVVYVIDRSVAGRLP